MAPVGNLNLVRNTYSFSDGLVSSTLLNNLGVGLSLLDLGLWLQSTGMLV